MTGVQTCALPIFFFILARQAFPNYYFLIVGALAIAIAAAAPAARERAR